MKGMKKYQQGLSMWEMMVLFLLIGFVLTCVLSLGPHYMDDRSVASALKNVHRDLSSKDLYEVKNNEIKGRLDKYFQVNTVGLDIAKQVEVVRESGKVLVILNYEVRENLIGNVDVVLSFEHEEDLSQPIDAD